MSEKYHKLWVLLRDKLTRYENDKEMSLDREVYHSILSEMSYLEAAEFLEE